MLVLSRKEGERFFIGENIVLTINRISKNRATIGIDAPEDIRILRSELRPTASAQPMDAAPDEDEFRELIKPR